MQFNMNKNILAIFLFSFLSSALYAQETDVVNDVDLLTDSINISTDSLENSALTQEQINRLNSQICIGDVFLTNLVLDVGIGSSDLKNPESSSKTTYIVSFPGLNSQI